MKIYGLIGQHLSHSFSPQYFNQKFSDLNLTNCLYKTFEIPNIEGFKSLIFSENNIYGLNVTIPYKESIIPYLNELEADAKSVGAVNTIKINRIKSGFHTVGYNTDIIGFKQSIKNHLPHICAGPVLILGTGGATAAVRHVLKSLNCTINQVSRYPNENELDYASLNEKLIKENKTIVNCTPVGMYPDIENYPAIPYESLNESHLLIDLIYNPGMTKFLQFGKERGAEILNGEVMLRAQAEASWEIWNSTNL